MRPILQGRARGPQSRHTQLLDYREDLVPLDRDSLAVNRLG
jgi:hypothetical protein